MNMLLLPNGDVMIHGRAMATIGGSGIGASPNWYLLQPDSTGSYAGQQVTTLTAMGTGRRFFTSEVLPNGTVFAYGGEDTNPGGNTTETNTGEIYNVAANSWSTISNTMPDTSNTFGDQASELLNNDTILAADPGDFTAGGGSYLYSVANGTWTATATGVGQAVKNTGDNEDNWVMLPNGDILDYEIRLTDNTANGNGFAQLYVPSGNQLPERWAGTSAGQWVNASSGLLALTSTNLDGDEGPGVLVPYYAPFSGPAVMYFGANGSTAFYNPSTNSWTNANASTNSYDAEPTYNIPGGASNAQLASEDGPAAVLPNGEVLVALCAQGTGGNYPGPTQIYLFNPANPPAGLLARLHRRDAV